MPQLLCDSPQPNDGSEALCSTAKPGMPTRPYLDSPATSPLKMRSSIRENTISMRCRICLESSTNEDLVSLCKCTGTMGLLHKTCLEEWLTVAQSGKCEICGFEFKVGIKPPTFCEWLTSGPEAANRRRHMWADLTCLIVMFPLVGICCWLTFHAFKTYAAISLRWEVLCIILLFTFIMAVFTAWMLIAARYHFKSWRQWRAENGRMAVENSVNVSYPVNSQRVQLTAANQSRNVSNSGPSRSQPNTSNSTHSIGHPSGLFPPPSSPPQFSLCHNTDFDNSILAGQIRSDDNAGVMIINYQHPNQGLQIL